MLSRTSQTTETLARLKTSWKDKNIHAKHKIRFMLALVITIFCYASETWTLTAELQRRIQSLDPRNGRNKFKHVGKVINIVINT